MAPVRGVLGVIVSCMVLGLARAQTCDRDIDIYSDENIVFEKMVFMSDAVVTGLVEKTLSDGKYDILLDCIYKTDGSRKESDIVVIPTDCPTAQLEIGNKYVMFLEKTMEGYKLRYTAFEAEVIYEVAASCGIERTAFTQDVDACPKTESNETCIRYPTTPKPGVTTPTPEPDATSKYDKETEKSGDVNVVVATAEPQGDGTSAATSNFLSCVLSCLSLILSLLVL
ncbi:uncharacterized protein LOC132555317 [Ylistrum balloti]|uniref:uncharacterized protein LOC132555317 n=1 Tax=Ylistrum balloti TaxID=509963 RepID=UPI002905E686|nr:uncharacterized protein LOC132555317 [Ylistrum balloti]